MFYFPDCFYRHLRFLCIILNKWLQSVIVGLKGFKIVKYCFYCYFKYLITIINVEVQLNKQTDSHNYINLQTENWIIYLIRYVKKKKKRLFKSIKDIIGVKNNGLNLIALLNCENLGINRGMLGINSKNKCRELALSLLVSRMIIVLNPKQSLQLKVETYTGSKMLLHLYKWLHTNLLSLTPR